MQIDVLKVTEYRKCPVIVRNFGNFFEYMTWVNGKGFYSTYIHARMPFYRKLFGKGYTMKEREDATRLCLTMAEASIDLALDGVK